MPINVETAITAVRNSKCSFCKFISPNDAGETGAHQSGLYIPKNSIELLFDEPGQKGTNKERFARFIWSDGEITEPRFIYYGQGSRNEYRITRLGKNLTVGELIVIARQNDTDYKAFLISEAADIFHFLDTFNLKEEQTNSLIPFSELENDYSKRYERFGINFKPKAHILILLGEELIKSPVMAIYELIKNGYDADATFVKVEFEIIEDLQNARIIIEDDGTGISEDVLTNVWFEPGSDFRKPIDTDGKRTIKRSPLFARIPMGEKGVGRFAVHKLGNKITLTTRPSKSYIDETGKTILRPLDYELEVDIDWRKFSQSKYLDDVIIEWRKNTNQNSFRFKNAPGTLIEISSLKEVWTRGMARQLKRNTISMLSPKNDLSKFRIELNFNNSWLDNIPQTDEILQSAPYKLNVLVDQNYNMTFEYRFELANNPEFGKREINKKTKDNIHRGKYETNIKGFFRPDYEAFLLAKGFDREKINELLNAFDDNRDGLPFGNLMIELYSFDLDSLSLRDYSSNPKLVKELLRDHAGIKVFKGDLRVYDYGDPGNDWLGLDILRVNNKEWFSNNQNIGYVYLDDSTSGSLVEKTNREGFIENDAYEHFKLIVLFILNAVRSERNSDREKWLLHNQKVADSSFEAQLKDFKSLISNIEIADSDKKQQLLSEAEKIEKRYEQDKNTLLIPAGVGMTASFAVHEIEKLVPRMLEVVEYDPVNGNKIRELVTELEDYVSGILSVLRKGGEKSVDVNSSIKQAVANYSLKLKHRKISVEYHFESDSPTVLCDKRLLITMLMNLIDNSMYWLDTVYKNDKGVFIKTERTESSISVLFVDNGPGFKDKVEDIVRPFFTRKKDGIGIGMYLIDTVMMKYGRLNIIYDSNYLKTRGVPVKYSGAAVELIFKTL